MSAVILACGCINLWGGVGDFEWGGSACECVLVCIVGVLFGFCWFVWTGPSGDVVVGRSGSTWCCGEALFCTCGGLSCVSSFGSGEVVRR